MTQTTGFLAQFGGVQVIIAPHAIETFYRFKKSKHRSRRLHKKLTRIFGEQTFQRPGAYMMAGKIFAHPEIIEAMRNDSRL
jgi:hypothetical protein